MAEHVAVFDGINVKDEKALMIWYIDRLVEFRGLAEQRCHPRILLQPGVDLAGVQVVFVITARLRPRWVTHGRMQVG